MSAVLSFREALAKFDPNQPRDEIGRWTEGGALDPRFGETDPADWEKTDERRAGGQDALASKLRKLLPPTVRELYIQRDYSATDSSLPTLQDRTLARAARAVAAVVSEMHEAGALIPSSIAILSGEGRPKMSGQYQFEDSPQTGILRVFLPPIPDDISLDDAAKAVFGGMTPDSPGYHPPIRTHVVSTFEDIVIHELGHAAHGRHGVGLLRDVREVAIPIAHSKTVSKYAGYNGLEFVAEVFTKHHLGDFGPEGLRPGHSLWEMWTKLLGPPLTTPLSTLRARASRRRIAA